MRIYLSVGISGLPDRASESVLSEKSVLGMSPGKCPGPGFKDLILLLAQSQTCQVFLSQALPAPEAPPGGEVGPGLCEGPGTKWPRQDCAWMSTLGSGKGSPLAGQWPMSFSGKGEWE